MKIYLVDDITANPKFIHDLFESYKMYDSFSVIDIVDEPEKADVYLFCTMGLKKEEILNIKSHPLVKAQIRKCYMICDQDFPIPVLPGLYTSLPRLNFISEILWNKHFRSIFYFANHNPYIKELRDSFKGNYKYLFSFTGSETSGIRRKLFNLKIDRTDVLLRKTNSTKFWQDFVWISGIRKSEDNKDYLRDYVNEILQSKFVLCPKGNGNCSYRFFEVMEAGRVPVVISDTYVFPNIPYNWDDIVIRVKEKDIHNIESIIAANETRFEKMAKLNRLVYDECFANKINYIQKCLVEINQSNSINSNFQYSLFKILWTKQISFYFSFKPLIGKYIGKLIQR